jgi:hypothetical protein
VKWPYRSVWWGRVRRDKGPDPADRKSIRMTLLTGQTYEVATAQALAAEAIVDELYAAIAKQMTIPSALLHYRRGHLVVRVDQIVLVCAYKTERGGE